ncbi:MAG: glycosyltransferase family 2 protein [Candidatus Methylumidiphilus sp.]
MAKQIKFTVIIPTRERASTLYYSLRTVLEQDYDDLTIIVSDNFSQDNTKDIVESFNDSRIQYINTGTRISMSHNFEFALRHVSEGWVTYLGDDDGMLPGALRRIAQVIAETETSALVSKFITYFWPKSTDRENQLMIYFSSGYEIRNSKIWLEKLMNGNANYYDLPYIYTGGFVDVKLIDKARSSSGDFFCSMIPDVYSAIALSSTIDKYVLLNEPICVNGISSYSTGTAQLGWTENNSPAQQFFSEKNIPFHPKLGSDRVKSIELLVYECYLQATHLHNDILKIDMAEQLGMALARASHEYRAELTKYCAEVAHKNGIDKNIVESFRRKNILNAWVSQFKILYNYWIKLPLDCTKYLVSNVYDAARLASVVYQFNNFEKYWRIKHTKNIIILIFSQLLSRISGLWNKK